MLGAVVGTGHVFRLDAAAATRRSSKYAVVKARVSHKYYCNYERPIITDSLRMDYIFSLYGCVFLLGVLGNVIIGVSLTSGTGGRNRNPLLLGLVTADFLVCCLSAPVTAVLYAISSITYTWSRTAVFFQSWPVSASTLSMMVISIDRYLTVKNYRPVGQVVRRRPLLLSIVATTWISAAVLSGLQFFERNSWRKTVLCVRITFTHFIPACIVFASHLGVHAKLTALSLTARARHGELPLPMPLLKRPTHVIIVAGIPNRLESQRCNGTGKQEGDSEDVQQPTPSTLRSRRRLANSLLWVAFVFIVCWTPHVVCLICTEVDHPAPILVERYCLLLGHVHSALNPLLYWIMNHQWPQRLFRFRLPVPALYRSASSTNEDALGPFHPRFVRPSPIRRRSSSYLF